MNNEIKFIHGNIFTSNCQTLVNTVNCVGVMGAGIALEFKYRYPDMFDKYVKYCNDGLIQIGKLWIYDVPNVSQKVLNFPTKQHWKYPSKYEFLEKGLKRFIETYQEKAITSIAFPMLGALNGGLEPEKVLDLMQTYLSQCDIPVEIYEYSFDASDDLIDKFRELFIYNNIKDLEKITHFKKNVITKLKEVFEKRELSGLIQLSKIKGLGEETLKACYKIAMDLKNKPKFIIEDIFTSANLEKENIEKDILLFPKEENTSLLNKLQLTGLDEQTILKIEQKEKGITIDALINYCKGLKLDLIEFFTKNYGVPIH